MILSLSHCHTTIWRSTSPVNAAIIFWSVQNVEQTKSAAHGCVKVLTLVMWWSE
jgi:hypothetical protein